MKYIICIALGFTSSQLLYDVSHRQNVPETGRYALGVLVLAVALTLCGASKEEVEQFLLKSGSVGAGVILARLI